MPVPEPNRLHVDTPNSRLCGFYLLSFCPMEILADEPMILEYRFRHRPRLAKRTILSSLANPETCPVREEGKIVRISPIVGLIPKSCQSANEYGI